MDIIYFLIKTSILSPHDAISLSLEAIYLLCRIVIIVTSGKDNITSADYCATRLRLEVKDQEVINEKAVKAAGAAGMIRPGKTSVQVVIGTQVQFVYDELKKLL